MPFWLKADESTLDRFRLARHLITRKCLVDRLEMADTVEPIDDYVELRRPGTGVAVDHEKTLTVGGDIEVAAKAQVGDNEKPTFATSGKNWGCPDIHNIMASP